MIDFFFANEKLPFKLSTHVTRTPELKELVFAIIIKAINPRVIIFILKSMLHDAQRQGLAMWRYSVLRKAGTEVESSTKDDIMQLAGIYS